jgi:hypothetical protein
MGRFGVKLGLMATAVLLLASLPGCSSGSPIATTVYPVPASIKIIPAPTLSLEIGTIEAFTTTVANSAGTAITEPFDFVSSDTSVVTVASNGLACAGSWDNLTSPTICTPGRAGTAQITATAQGVSSAATTIYVHQHIDSVTLQDMCSVAVPPAPCTIPRHLCQSLLEPTTSLPQNTVYEAHAFSRGVDITPTVGQFAWSAGNFGVVTLSNTPVQLANIVNGTSLNQVQATAKAPGFTTVFATIGTATSVPVNFTTCAVQSIALAVTEATATSKTIIPTVTDTVGNVISTALTPGGIPLTWSSSQSASVTAAAGSATGSTGGGATIVASCTPPTCNIGFSPSLPIYPEQAVPVILTPTGTTTTTTATVYVGSTACGTTENCVSTVIPVTTPSTLGAAIALPATPNSFVFDRQGSKVFIGTDSGLAGARGLMELDSSSNTVTQFTSTPGKVLAVSPDGTAVVVSDTVDTPNQVFVFDTTAGTNTAFGITGATAADFSPDSLKAYIIAGSTLYVYSKVDALQTIFLGAPANDVAFFAEGAFAYLAGGDPAGVVVHRTCDNGQADTVSTTSAPTFIRALPDATQMLAVVPPDVALINANTTPVGCTPTVTDTVTSINLGQSPFTASQLIIAEDGSTAYILSPDLNSILVFDIGAQTSSTLSLLGNATPIQGSLTPDGTLLLVGASDGMVHEIQTATGVDVTQIQFPNGLCLNPAALPFPGLTCNPNLVAVKP